MSEVSFFPKYEQKENRVTNYTLLVLKQLYNESPNLFQEFIINLIKNDEKNIDVGVNFWQQKGFECDNGKSILDGVITQDAFTIFIETKLSDWFYSEQLKTHLSNLIELQGQKIFLALSNFDGQKSEVFEKFMNEYKDNTDVIFAYFDFGNFIDILKNLKSKIKSEQLLVLFDDFEEFLYNENLLPLWKYRLDVVNCAKTKDFVKNNLIYTCPEAKGAYKHLRSKFFGIYEDKKVNTIAEIQGVCSVNKNDEIGISWWDNDKYSSNELIEKAKKLLNKIPEYRPIQVFLLNNLRENINFYKDTHGGMYCSKIYFTVSDNIKNIDDLVNALKDKSWSNY